MPFRRILAAGAAAFLAVGLAACESDPSPRERLASAPEATISGGTAAFSVEASVQRRKGDGGSAAPAPTLLTADGVVDFGDGSSRTQMRFGAFGLSMEVRSSGDTIYLRLPELAGRAGGRWVRRPLDEGAGPGADPTGAIRALDRLRGPVSRLGQERVREVEVSGFGFSTPGEALWPKPREAPAAVRELEIPTRAWLDARGRLRRLALEVELASVAEAARAAAGDSLPGRAAAALGMLQSVAGDRAVLAMTLDLFDFGREVSVAPPEGVEVIDVDSLRRMAPGAADSAGSLIRPGDRRPQAP